MDAAGHFPVQWAIQARFIGSDMYRLPKILSDRFDIAFSSYGVLHWLPDLRRWAENHGIGEAIIALSLAGLTIEYVHEFDSYT